MRELDEVECFAPVYRTLHVAVTPLAATNIGGSPHECNWGLSIMPSWKDYGHNRPSGENRPDDLSLSLPIRKGSTSRGQKSRRISRRK
jgi:hypothetical protein